MTPAEKRLVARRARGEYGVNSACERIWREHKKSEETMYTAFLAAVYSSQKAEWDEYAALAKPLIACHPNPWSPKEKVRDITPDDTLTDEPKVSADPVKPKPRPKPKRKRKPKLVRGIRALRAALREPWPTRGLGADQQEDEA